MPNREAKTLINFYVDKATRSRFDEVCRASGKTRTQVLVALMENHVMTEVRVLEQRLTSLAATDQILAQVRTYEELIADQIREEEAEMPPTIFWSEDPDPIEYF